MISLSTLARHLVVATCTVAMSGVLLMGAVGPAAAPAQAAPAAQVA